MRWLVLIAAVLALPARADLPADGHLKARNDDRRPVIICFDLVATGAKPRPLTCTTGTVEPYAVGFAYLHPSLHPEPPYEVRARAFVRDGDEWIASPHSDYGYLSGEPMSASVAPPFVEPEP